MSFQIAYATDKGIVKQGNEDSFLAVTARGPSGYAAFVVLCDGMGGLSKGELASAEVVRTFSGWFRDEFPLLWRPGLDAAVLQKEWERLIASMNGKILNFGRQNHVQLGTTATGLLLTKERYYGFHVGDSRAYEISGQALRQLTRDHSVVQRDVDRGILTPEEAKISPRRNVLLQCIGASSTVTPDFFEGTPSQSGLYLLCSDGFVHELSEQELREAFAPEKMKSRDSMEDGVKALVELIKARGEKDNITAVLVREAANPEDKEETA